MANNQNNQQQSRQKFGTLTAMNDANNDYSSSTFSNSTENKQQASKAKYGTLTAKADANNDYE